MDIPYTPKQKLLNVLNQAMVSLQDSSDNEIMIPEILNAIRLLNECEVTKTDKPDTPDIDTIALTNYENRRL